MEAVWRPGSRWQIEAQEAHLEIEEIRQRDGVVTTEAVVESATAEDSVLHNAFEWDNGLAGHQHRLAQARLLIRSIRIIREPGAAHIPAYVNVRVRTLNDEDEEETRRFYQSVDVVIADEALLASAIAMLSSRLASSQVALDELKALVDRDDRLLQRVAAVTEAVATARRLAMAL